MDAEFDFGGQHYQQMFNLPGGRCGIGEAQTQIDLGLQVEVVDDGSSTVLSGPDAVILEGTGTNRVVRVPITVRALVPGDTPTNVKGHWQVTAGSASDGSDYTIITRDPNFELQVTGRSPIAETWIEIAVVTDTEFEDLNELFTIELFIDVFDPPNPEDQLFEGFMHASVTLQNDDEPSKLNYPAGVLTPPDGALAYWNFDVPGSNGFSFTPQGVELPVGFEPTDFEFSEKPLARRGLPGVVRDQGRIWLDDSKSAQDLKPSLFYLPYYEFTVDPGGGIQNYSPDKVQFYTWTEQGNDAWELSWSLDGKTFMPVATSNTVPPTVGPNFPFHGWQRYDVDLPSLAEPGEDGLLGTDDDKQFAFFAKPITFRLRNTGATDIWYVDSVSVIGDWSTTTEETLLELARFLERMDTRLPYDLDVFEAGKIQAGIGPEVMVDGGSPQPAIFIELFETNLDSTYITLDSGSIGAGSSLPVVIRTDGDLFGVDSIGVDFLGRIDIGGDVFDAVYVGSVKDNSQIGARDSNQCPLSIYSYGDWGTPGDPTGVHVTSNTQLETLSLSGSWYSGKLIGNDVGEVNIFGDFAAGVALKRGFDGFHVTDGDFNPSEFATGLADFPGAGDSGSLVVTNGDMRGNVEIGGRVNLVKVDSGDMHADITATHIGTVVGVTQLTQLVGGDVNGSIHASTIRKIDITGGDLNAGVTLTDPSWDRLDMQVRAHNGKGGRINSPGSLHIAGGVQLIAANDILMGLHVGGHVGEIVVSPVTGTTGALRGNFDAGSFGTIRASHAEIDVDITVKHEAWQLGTQPGIGKIVLVDSTWKNGSIHLPAGVTTGPIIVDGDVLDWNDPDGLPMQSGYRLEVIQSGLQQNAFVIPASWTNPTDNLDVNNDGFLSPIDALLVINQLNRSGTTQPARPSLLGDLPAPFRDSNGDSFVSPLDALLVINRLNRRGDGEGEVSVAEQLDSMPVTSQSRRDSWMGPWPGPSLGRTDGENQQLRANVIASETKETDGKPELPTGHPSEMLEYERSVRRALEDDDLWDDESWEELIGDLLKEA